jgi:hypothetical protein
MRSKRLAQAKPRIGAARKRLDEVVALGVY